MSHRYGTLHVRRLAPYTVARSRQSSTTKFSIGLGNSLGIIVLVGELWRLFVN